MPDIFPVTGPKFAGFSKVHLLGYYSQSNNDFGGLFWEYGLTYKILNNFVTLENQT